jgi:diguanylate cyclase (GGDEF)-like protein
MKLRVLLVDDNDNDRAAIRRMLDEGDIDVTLVEATDGATAIEAFRSDRIDCVLLDSNLDGNGSSVVLEMVRDHQSSSTVILLTDSRDDQAAIRMLERGVAECVTKSLINSNALARVIRYSLARQQFLTHLRDLGHIDVLTGLPNRAFFDKELNAAIAQSKRTGKLLAVAMLDLDNFKDINDMHGHPFGDLFLKAVSDRLTGAVRESDFVARFGGDEFAIIGMNLDEAQGAFEIANKLKKAFVAPYEIEGVTFNATTSIGVSLFPSDAQNSANLIKCADVALYQAKEGGRGAFRFFDSGMTSRIQAFPLFKRPRRQ